MLDPTLRPSGPPWHAVPTLCAPRESKVYSGLSGSGSMPIEPRNAASPCS
jgi:hypothetical protein